MPRNTGTPLNSESVSFRRLLRTPKHRNVGDVPGVPGVPAALAEREARYQAALAKAEASRPKACPRCGSSRIQPTWLAPDEWDCAELSCAAVWTVEAAR